MTTLSEIKIENLKSFENNPFIFSAEACRRLGIETRIDLTSTQPVTKFRTDEIIGKENNESREMRGDVNARKIKINSAFHSHKHPSSIIYA